MPRTYRGKGRGSKNIGGRFNIGAISGVTFHTIPSGVTLDQNGIRLDGGVSCTDITSGGTIEAVSTVSAPYFYNTTKSAQIPSYGGANNVLIKSGVTTTKGGVSQVFVGGAPPTGTAATGAFFGLTSFTTITQMFVIRHSHDGVSGNSNYTFSVDCASNAATVFYHSMKDPIGAGSGKCTIRYFVIGT